MLSKDPRPLGVSEVLTGANVFSVTPIPRAPGVSIIPGLRYKYDLLCSIRSPRVSGSVSSRRGFGSFTGGLVSALEKSSLLLLKGVLGCSWALEAPFRVPLKGCFNGAWEVPLGGYEAG